MSQQSRRSRHHPEATALEPPPSASRPPPSPPAPVAGVPRPPAALAYLLAAVLAPFFLIQVKDPDVWWHMATGRWILEHHAFPTTDPFTYTMVGKPWLLMNPIAEVVLYGAYCAAGPAGLVVLKALAAFLTLSLVGLCLREVTPHRNTLVALVAATALLVHGRFTQERPLILGAVLLAAAELAVLRTCYRKDRSFLLFLPALPLWPLVHGTALLGVAQLGTLLAAGVVGQLPRRRLAFVAGVLAICLLLCPLLPWWRGLLITASGLGAGATATTFTAEWRSGAAALPDRIGHFAVISLGIMGGILTARTRVPLLLLSALAATISLKFARNAFEGVLLAVPACAVAIDRLGDLLRRRGGRLLGSSAAPLVAGSLCAVQFAVSPSRTINGPFGFGVVQQLFPFDTLETLRKLPVHRLMNDFPTGGFLIWENGPWGVYCDGRTVALYAEEDVQRLFVPMLESSEALTSAADYWGATYALVLNRQAPFHWLMLSNSWDPVHVGLGTSLFVRRPSAGELPRELRPLPLIRAPQNAEWMRTWYAAALKDDDSRRRLLTQFREAARRSPQSPILVDILRTVASLDPLFSAALEEAVIGARR